MKKTIYMTICIALNVVAIIGFKDYIRLSALSGMSVSFMLLLGFMSWSFNITKKGEMPLNVGGSTELNDEEIAKLGEVLQTVSLGMIPLFIPFIFFLAIR